MGYKSNALNGVCNFSYIIYPSHQWLGYGIFLKKKLQTNQGSIAWSFARENVNSLAQSFTTGNKINVIQSEGIHALTKE